MPFPQQAWWRAQKRAKHCLLFYARILRPTRGINAQQDASHQPADSTTTGLLLLRESHSFSVPRWMALCKLGSCRTTISPRGHAQLNANMKLLSPLVMTVWGLDNHPATGDAPVKFIQLFSFFLYSVQQQLQRDHQDFDRPTVISQGCLAARVKKSVST